MCMTNGVLILAMILVFMSCSRSLPQSSSSASDRNSTTYSDPETRRVGNGWGRERRREVIIVMSLVVPQETKT